MITDYYQDIKVIADNPDRHQTLTESQWLAIRGLRDSLKGLAELGAAPRPSANFTHQGWEPAEEMGHIWDFLGKYGLVKLAYKYLDKVAEEENKYTPPAESDGVMIPLSKGVFLYVPPGLS